MNNPTSRRAGRRSVPLAQRFEANIDKSGDCWLWTASGSNGYGTIMEGPSRKKLYAHRVAYEMAYGPIPEGMVVDHLCHVTLCVNPSHLRAVTSKQNSEHKAGPASNNKSGYLGVYEYFPGCWRGKAKHHGRDYYTGRCNTPEEAAEAARLLRLKLFTHNDLDK